MRTPVEQRLRDLLQLCKQTLEERGASVHWSGRLLVSSRRDKAYAWVNARYDVVVSVWVLFRPLPFQKATLAHEMAHTISRVWPSKVVDVALDETLTELIAQRWLWPRVMSAEEIRRARILLRSDPYHICIHKLKGARELSDEQLLQLMRSRPAARRRLLARWLGAAFEDFITYVEATWDDGD
jgi:hypothetical protein